MAPRWMLLRGLSRGNGHWGNFPELLKSKGVDVELQEIPGNGTWHSLETPLEAENVIEKIRSHSEFCKSKKKFNICGISLGGMVALKWAELHRKEIGTVAVINSSFKQYSSFHQRLKPNNYLKMALALLNPDVKSREKLILNMVSNRPERIEKLSQDLADFSIQNPVSIANFTRQLILASKISLQTDIPAKVKVITSEGDHLVESICSLKLAEALGVEPIVHPTAGHDIPFDEPEWLIKILLET